MIYVTRCLHEILHLISKKSHQYHKSMIHWKNQQMCPLCTKNFSELHEKVDDLLCMMRAITAKQSKKCAYDETSSTNETPPAAHVRIKSGATDALQYIARAKKPSI